MKGDNC